MTAPAAQSLYSRDVLRLATALPHNDRIANADGSATRRSAVCGSEMSIDAAIDNGLVTAIAIRARACALGQASAAILRECAIGQSRAQIEMLAQQVATALKGEDRMPDQFSPLAYAQGAPARHGAILLPFETLLAALD